MDVSNPSMKSEVFDAIVCDPPYGVRAMTKQIGIRENKKIKEKKEVEEEDEPHFSQKKHYGVDSIYTDLLENAARILRPGGRLVFLYHTDTSLPEEENRFPEHPMFEFVCSSENDLTKCRSRHLITMVKKQ
jgi:tRNA (guanine10-N2)-methyltransferase